MKSLLQKLRRKWLRGPYSRFDVLIAELANCDLETAGNIRESWEDLNIIAYDKTGFLIWCRPEKEAPLCP